MRAVDWVNEAKSLQTQVLKLEQSYRGYFNSGQMQILKKRWAINQWQNQFIKLSQGLNQLCTQSKPQSPMNRAILHWTRVLCSEFRRLYRRESRHLGQMMWLKLVKQRLTQGPVHADLLVEDDELIPLAVRLKDLRMTEKLLKAQLQELEHQQSAKRLEYERELATQGNLGAAGSLQGPLGRGLKGARSNPHYLALEDYVRALLAKNRRNQQLEQHLGELGSALKLHSRAAVSACRRLILYDKKPELFEAELCAIEYSLQSAEELRRQLFDLGETFMKGPAPSARPFFLKKGPQLDTKEDSSISEA